jgi:hypothetical protein
MAQVHLDELRCAGWEVTTGSSMHMTLHGTQSAGLRQSALPGEIAQSISAAAGSQPHATPPTIRTPRAVRMLCGKKPAMSRGPTQRLVLSRRIRADVALSDVINWWACADHIGGVVSHCIQVDTMVSDDCADCVENALEVL